MKSKNVISLFAGAGGMDLGFKKAGFNIIWANDFEKDAVTTYKNNIGDHIVYGDITKIDIKNELPNEEEIDLVIGGFPCQGFSVNNIKRNMKDKRNFLYLELLKVIELKKPKFFVAENVKGLLSMEKGKVIDMIVKDFENLGYEVDYQLLNAADYGVPQARERVIIIGNRIGVENPFPVISHVAPDDNLSFFDYKSDEELKTHVTVEEAIGFLGDIEIQNGKVNDYIKVNDRKIYNHVASTKVGDKFFGRKYSVNQHDICDYLRFYRDKSEWTTKKIDEHFGYKHTAGHWFRKDNNSGSIPKPKDWWELKKILKFDDKYDKVVTTFVEKDIKFEQSLRITNWDRPSDTITATMPEIHVNKTRRLSARECAILQTFPDDFVFYGALNSLHRQIGNAVPVLLAEKIGLEIGKVIDKN
ncbi:DNA cytosine methyltransferase [Staphylococcus hominis]|uniref:DNA cytosine methyltransferase n=2 Tax=Staphylococcus hominis TaxID=1290 RepID=UPI00019FCC39|nr:DNA cytosine methyltransferase [Staphylococcus hominis]EEK12558.1 DNA (cytosine-5-)-methyltransferase [Staphylococcus hominis SK119]MBC2955782.1 DNA cytosine methyltransferase [Staphylococcus hominis]MBU5606530.1 DNA cytosine methyltransferase [Staphylococcus hominis]MDK7201823.1 DNA cytosine methyltransferase [Staphylococcus hominis]MDS3856006.1 DNA cytosine methyltransferase [Staphylococcus hominis]